MTKSMKPLKLAFLFLITLSTMSARADILSQGSDGSIIAKIPGNQLVIYSDGTVSLSGKSCDCSSDKDKSFIVGSSVLNCSLNAVSLASPAGSFNYSADDNSAQVVLTSGSVEQRSFKRVLEKSANHKSVDVDIDDDESEEVVVRNGNVQVDTANGSIHVESGQDGQNQVHINNAGAATESGMNILGSALGGLTAGASGDAKAGKDTEQGFGVLGKSLGGLVNGAMRGAGSTTGEIDIKSADGNSVKIKNGNIEANSNGNSWRISTSKKNFDTTQVMQELKVRQKGDEIEFDMADEVLFDFNSAVVKPAASKTLEKIAFLIKKKSMGEVVLEGHTDSIGGDAENLALSKKRVESVIKWLVEAEGIPVNIINGKAFGESKPVAYNTLPDGSDNPEGRAKNRRVSFRFKSE